MTITRPRAAGRVPGEPEFWILIFGELTAFLLLFGVWGWVGGHHREQFSVGHSEVNVWIGALNTVLLLTGSLAVATGLAHLRADRPDRARRWYAVAIACGLAFLLVKAGEYATHLSDHGQLHNPFFTWYFALTGIHVLHVVVGLVALSFAYRQASTRRLRIAAAEGIGVYWHMVDAVWIVIFYLVYIA